MRPSAVLPCVLLTAAATLVTAPAVAAAPQPTCGSTITVDTVLRRNLVCDGPGLRLAAGVDLDLGGRTVRGTAGGVGLEVSADGPVSVRNGTLTGWDTAIDTWGSEEWETRGPLVVDRMVLRDNARGIDVTGKLGVDLWAKEATVTNSTFTGHSIWAVAETQGLRIERSVVADNTVGIFADASTQAVDVRFRRNGHAVVQGEGGRVLVDRSTFDDNPTAVVSYHPGEVEVTDSKVRGSDVAFDVQHDEAELSVRSSVLERNTTVLRMRAATGELVGNVVRDNGTTLELLQDEPWGLMPVRDNRFYRNDDGIAVDAPGVLVLSGNQAYDNRGWGIHAPGAVDEGRNRAWGNANEPQCVGVVCRGRS